MKVIIKRIDDKLVCNVPRDVIHHSPDGFECGYGGSGPADLALNIMQLFTANMTEERVKCHKGECTRTAWELYQDFKWEFIAPMPREGGIIEEETIREWIKKKKEALSDSKSS